VGYQCRTGEPPIPARCFWRSFSWFFGNALALALGGLATRIGAIVKEERSVTADTALRLARFFGNSAEFWINLQAMHDLTKARLETGATIEREVQPKAA